MSPPNAIKRFIAIKLPTFCVEETLQPNPKIQNSKIQE
jgi:hypothetical protein